MIIMNKNEKDFMEQLNDFDDEYVEEIAEDYPALDENDKKRILKQCLKKSGLPDGDITITENTMLEEDNDDGISVSGTERYKGSFWRKYAGSAAALAVAVVGIASIAILHGNMNVSDDFDISDSSVVTDDSDEQIQVTEIVSGSYIDKGYRAGGFDYANQNDYQGIIIGGTTAPPPTPPVDTGHVVDSVEVPEPDNHEDNNAPAHNQPDVPPVTAPLPVTPPATTTTTAVVLTTTAQPVTTIQTVTTVPTTDQSVTEPTESTSNEAQKTFLEGRYFIVKDNGTLDGFEFFPDGTIRPFIFNAPEGTFKRYTDDIFGYEIIGNQLSYGYIGDEVNWKTGTIINPNDTTTFSVQFPDDIYTFSTDTQILETFLSDRITLEGVWYGNSAGGLRKLEFYDDVSGNMTYIESGTGIGFSYSIDGNSSDVVFNIGSNDNVINGTLISYHEGTDMVISWQDGTVESFYSEQQWLEMNQ